MRRLAKEQKDTDAELEKLGNQAEQCEKDMEALKVVLYTKFGKAINLDE